MTTTLMGEPSPRGRFGEFGGRFVPETLVPACEELERAFRSAWGDPEFRDELDVLLRDYAGRPSPITECRRLSSELGVVLRLGRICSPTRFRIVPNRPERRPVASNMEKRAHDVVVFPLVPVTPQTSMVREGY